MKEERLSKEIGCPWCGEKVVPESRIVQRKAGEVIERSCPNCAKVIAAYLNGESFLDLIHERVITFKD